MHCTLTSSLLLHSSFCRRRSWTFLFFASHARNSERSDNVPTSYTSTRGTNSLLKGVNSLAADFAFISQSFQDSETVLLTVTFQMIEGKNEESFIYAFNSSSFCDPYCWSTVIWSILKLIEAGAVRSDCKDLTWHHKRIFLASCDVNDIYSTDCSADLRRPVFMCRGALIWVGGSCEQTVVDNV